MTPGDPPPEDGLLGPLTDEEFDLYLEVERPFFEAANADHAAEQLAWRESLEMPTRRQTRYDQVDARTRELIAEGYDFAGKRFSLSIQAQSTLTGGFNIRDSLSYPVRWNTLDNTDYHDVADAAELATMYATAASAIRSILDGGSVLKASIRDATTFADLDAVTDDR